jgi:hypothetical protein
MLSIGDVGAANCGSMRGVRALGLNNRSQKHLFSRSFQTGQRIRCPAPGPARVPRNARKISAQAGDRAAEEKFSEGFTDQYKEQSRKYRRTVRFRKVHLQKLFTGGPELRETSCVCEGTDSFRGFPVLAPICGSSVNLIVCVCMTCVRSVPGG